MAGLLAPPQQPQTPPEQMPPEEEMPESEGESPQFGQVMQFAYQALYSENAGKNVALAIKKAQNKAEALAHVTYEMASIAMERAGDVPEEELILLASQLLSEVAEIAEAAGTDITNHDIGEALKIIILRALGEAGQDTTQLKAAMDQFTPEMMEQAYKYGAGEEQEQGAPQGKMQEQMMGA